MNYNDFTSKRWVCVGNHPNMTTHDFQLGEALANLSGCFGLGI